MTASSLLVLVVLSFLLAAAQSGSPYDELAAKGLPRGIFPDHYLYSGFNTNTGALQVLLHENTCTLNFSSEVSELVYLANNNAILTPGKLEFTSLVAMKVGPTALDILPVKKIVSPFHPMELTLEFWSSETHLAATVLPSAFSQERPCSAKTVRENPGATINDLAKVSPSI